MNKLPLLILFIGYTCLFNQVTAQLDAVSAVFSVVPIGQMLAPAGLVGVQLTAMSKLLRMLGYDQKYLASLGGTGTAASPIGLQKNFAYMFPYVPGLNVSIREEHSGPFVSQNKDGPPSDRKTHPSMMLPGEYEFMKKFRNVDISKLFKQAGLNQPMKPQQADNLSKGNYRPTVNIIGFNNHIQSQNQLMQPTNENQNTDNSNNRFKNSNLYANNLATHNNQHAFNQQPAPLPNYAYNTANSRRPTSINASPHQPQNSVPVRHTHSQFPQSSSEYDSWNDDDTQTSPSGTITELASSSSSQQVSNRGPTSNIQSSNNQANLQAHQQPQNQQRPLINHRTPYQSPSIPMEDNPPVTNGEESQRPTHSNTGTGQSSPDPAGWSTESSQQVNMSLTTNKPPKQTTARPLYPSSPPPALKPTPEFYKAEARLDETNSSANSVTIKPGSLQSGNTVSTNLLSPSALTDRFEDVAQIFSPPDTLSSSDNHKQANSLSVESNPRFSRINQTYNPRMTQKHSIRHAMPYDPPNRPYPGWSYYNNRRHDNFNGRIHN